MIEHDALDPEGEEGNMADGSSTVSLDDFEGKPVIGVAVEVRGVSGGLNKAMGVDPVVLMQGERAFIAYEVVADKIRHDPAEKDEKNGPQIRVQIFDAEKAVILTGEAVDVVSSALDAQHARVVEHAEAVEREQATLKAKAKEAREIEANRAKGQEPIVEADGSVNPEAAAVETDEVTAKRDENVGKSTAAAKAAGRQVNPNPKKASGAKRAPAKRSTRKPRKATH